MSHRLALACLFITGCGKLLGLEHVDPPPPPDAPPLIDAATGYARVVLVDQPVLYLPLYDANSTTAVDLVQAEPGQILGNVKLGDPPARPEFRSSMTFDGSNGAVDIGDTFPFVGLAPYSVEAWIEPMYMPRTFYTVVSKWHELSGIDGPAAGWNLYYINGFGLPAQIAFSREPSATVVSAELPDGWHHVVGTFDGTTLVMYVDGHERAMMPASNPLDDQHKHLLIGAGNTQTGEPTYGSIDQVAVYDRALTADQVLAHFNAASP